MIMRKHVEKTIPSVGSKGITLNGTMFEYLCLKENPDRQDCLSI